MVVASSRRLGFFSRPACCVSCSACDFLQLMDSRQSMRVSRCWLLGTVTAKLCSVGGGGAFGEQPCHSARNDVRCFCRGGGRKIMHFWGKVTLAGTGTGSRSRQACRGSHKPPNWNWSRQGSPNFIFWPKRLWGVLGRNVLCLLASFKVKSDSFTAETQKFLERLS
jgi:hypothetical protein